MRQILEQGNIQLTKSLGQNFLHDGNQLKRIVAAAEVSRADRVLEIGPGLGPLTELLLQEAGDVLAIEKDARLVTVLQRRFAAELEPLPAPRLRLLHADALDYLKGGLHDWSQWKLVSNLPYSVASPLLVDLAQAPQRPRRLVATLQLEVAQRMMAPPGHPDYGILTLLIQAHYEPLSLFKVPAGCFFPEPDVDSACVALVRREPALLAPGLQEGFVRLVKRSFSQRRKMMFKLLKADWATAALETAFSQLGISTTARAETVSLHQFIQLAQALHTNVE
jgi:16S rRNA (adenine1518-N6/adenine1519-N6)-dimethyltransferase